MTQDKRENQMAIKWVFDGDSYVEIITDKDGNVTHVISGGNRDPEVELVRGKPEETVRVQEHRAMPSAHADHPRAMVGITNIPQSMGTWRSPVDTVVNFELPSVFTVDDMRKFEKDLEILGNLVHDHKKQMRDLHNAVLEGRLADAAAIGRKLGLQEHQFIAAGGGFGALCVGIAVALIAVMVLEAASPPGGVDHGEPPGMAGGGGGGDDDDGEGEVGGADLRPRARA